MSAPAIATAAKPFYKSKVFWFNFIIGLFGFVENQLSTQVIGNGTLASVLAAGNLVLRAMTTQGVTLK